MDWKESIKRVGDSLVEYLNDTVYVEPAVT